MWIKGDTAMKHIVKDADKVVERINNIRKQMKERKVRFANDERKKLKYLESNANKVVNFFKIGGGRVDMRTLNHDVNFTEDVKIITRLETAIQKADVRLIKEKKGKEKGKKKKERGGGDSGGGGGGL
eukprot:1231723-Rhodomonas_salina.1